MPEKNKSKAGLSSGRSYLSRLRFDRNLLKSPVAKYLSNIRLVVLLVITIFSLGTVGYINLPKRLNPEIKIPIVNISTVLPGASPEDIENLVTVPLENAVKNVKGIDTVASSSRENLSVISIQFISSVNAEKAKQDVQAEVDSVNDLPSDAKPPKVMALDFEDQPIWTFALTTQLSPKALSGFSAYLKKKLEENPKVDRVVLNGEDSEEITVNISPEKLKAYGINPLELSQLIKKNLSSYPAGGIETSGNTFSLSIDPQISDIKGIRDVKISVSGKTINLSDIAEIYYSARNQEAVSYIAKRGQLPENAVTFNLYKASASNIDESGRAMRMVIENEIGKREGDFEIISILDTSKLIGDQFADLLKEFRSTIILIVVCLFIFLGVRQAFISSLTVPLTFLSAFFLMNIFHQSINFLTLFALLLTLGLLIDDTIVVVSAMTSYYKTGKFTPLETGVLVWRDTIVPIWSTTITTIWSFVPLLLSAGIIGEFIKPIPTVVTVTMVSSTAIAVLITLPFMIILLKPQVAPRVRKFIKLAAAVFVLVLLYLVSPKNIIGVIIFILFMISGVIFTTNFKSLVRIGGKIHQKKQIS